MPLGLLSFVMVGGVRFNPATDIPSLHGKVILVTGGNSGLGKQSVLELARHSPAMIWLAARGEARAQAAIDDILKEVPGANLKPLDLDLASFESVKAAARRVLGESDRLDILMLNAGIMASPPGLTKDGYEIQFGTNHVGHALLTKLLLPQLLKTAEKPDSDVRVVVLSSDGHKLAPRNGINFDDLKTPQAQLWKATRYGQSKLANILFSAELARRYPQIKSISLHPGLVESNLSNPVAESSLLMRYCFVPVSYYLFSVSAAEGAKTQLWAAVSPDAESGKYYIPVGRGGTEQGKAKDEWLARRLWEWTEKELEGQEI